MSGLHDALDGYLTVRRALGHKLTGAEYLLRQFLDWLEQAGAATITTDLALAWALQPAASAVYHAQRLSAVRGFASWLHSSDPLTQVPPAGLLPARHGPCLTSTAPRRSPRSWTRPAGCASIRPAGAPTLPWSGSWPAPGFGCRRRSPSSAAT
jgi:hypothetical protein